MITAVDTNVLIDIFLADVNFHQKSARALTACLDEGSVVACNIVWIELAPLFPSMDRLRDEMSQLGIAMSFPKEQATWATAEAWKRYRTGGGKKERVVADFLIGAHALVECDRLLTRDRGFYRKYFQMLTVVEP